MKIRTERIKRLNDENLLDLATIMYEPGVINDNMGGESLGEYWDVYDQDVPCRISPLYGSERIIGYTIDPIKDVLIIFSDVYSIADDKRIVINNIEYEILYIEPKRTFSSMIRVIGREI